jgi:hypothetical protein
MKIVSKNIEMIAYFKESGMINPIRFRIQEEDKYEVIKIDKIVKTDLQKLCGNKMWIYTCCGVVRNVEKIFEIIYDIEKCKWILFKI